MLSTAYYPRYISTFLTHTIYYVVHAIYPQHMSPTAYDRDTHDIYPRYMYPTVYGWDAYGISPTLYPPTSYNTSSTLYVFHTAYAYGVGNIDIVPHGI